MKNTLTIIISTLNDGIKRTDCAVKIVHPSIKYLIIHQNHNNTEIPVFLNREDIKVIQTKTIGLSKSRNIGLQNCETSYAIIADDDVEYLQNGLNEVLRIINNDSPDFATFKIKTPDGEPDYKSYPNALRNLNKEEHHNISSIELLLNIDRLRKHNIKFDERFGLGARLKKGEEEIFVSDLKKANLIGTFYPINLVRHPYESSGKTILKESYNYFLKGAVFTREGKAKPSFKHFGSIRKLKNQLFYYCGKYYIKLTND